jgi:hypothetical protein
MNSLKAALQMILRKKTLLFWTCAIIISLIVSILLGNKLFVGLGDAGFTLWTLDSNFQKILNLDFANFFDANIFYPYSNSLSFSDHLLTETFISLPLYLLARNSIICWNFTYILSFFISFAGMYLLSNKFLKDSKVAVISSLIFSFCLFRMIHLGHYQLQFFGFFAFCIYYFEAILENKKVVKNTILFGVTTLFVVLANVYFEVFYILLLLTYFLPRFVYKNGWRHKKTVTALLVTTIVIGILVAIPSLKLLSFSRYHHAERTNQDFNAYSVNFFDIFFPSTHNRLYGDLVKTFNEKLGRDRKYGLFVGIIPFSFSIVGLISILLKRKKNIVIKIAKDVRLFFLLQVLFYFSLTLGPVLKFASAQVDIITPFDLFSWLIFPLRALRAIARIFLISNLFISLLAGYGLKKFFRSISNIKFGKFQKALLYCAFFIIAIIATIENFGWKPKTTDIAPTTDNATTDFLEDIKEANFLFLPGMLQGDLLSEDIRPLFYNVPISYELYTLGKQNDINLFNGYSGYFPSGTRQVQEYISQNGINENVLILLDQIDINYLGINYEFLNEKYEDSYKSTLSSHVENELISEEHVNDTDNIILYRLNHEKVENLYKKQNIKQNITISKEGEAKNSKIKVVFEYENPAEYPFGQKEVKHSYKVKIENSEGKTISTTNLYLIEPVFISESSVKEIPREIGLPNNSRSNMTLLIWENDKIVYEVKLAKEVYSQ